jgi:hypothetical protein
LNAEEEPEDPDYPKGPDFKSKFGPRGVLDVTASDKDDEYEDPRFGAKSASRLSRIRGRSRASE